MIALYKSNRGFTLIELILVIVILGVLSAVAIPKYKAVRENAEFNSLMKVLYDSLSSVPAAFKSAVDLEGENPDNITLPDLISVTGKNWSYNDSEEQYEYGSSAKINLDKSTRRLSVSMNCQGFTNDKLKEICKDKFNAAETDWAEVEAVEF